MSQRHRREAAHVHATPGAMHHLLPPRDLLGLADCTFAPATRAALRVERAIEAAMVIAGCGQTLVDLLTARLTESGLIGDFDVALMAPREITKDLQNRIAIILYRIE